MIELLLFALLFELSVSSNSIDTQSVYSITQSAMEKVLTSSDAKLFLNVEKINKHLREFGKVKFIVGSLVVFGERKKDGLNCFCYRYVGEPWLDDIQKNEGISFLTPIDEFVLTILIVKNGISFCSSKI